MGRLLLFENEELVARFRPHPMSYGRRYLTSLLWVIPGGLGGLITVTVGGAHPIAWGLVALAAVALLSGLTFARITKTRSGFPWFGAAVALGFVVADVFHALTWSAPAWTLPVALGAALGILRLMFWELERLSRVHYLTTERLVLQGGVGSRRERTVQLKRVQEVRSHYGFLGQALDYGNLTLVLNRVVRGKEAQVFEEQEVLAGIGRVTEIKHHLEQLVEETKMPQKDRRRRVEERRVKESMRVLARWMRRDQRSRP
ncbi:MAG TPA: PH domain-containing protein [Candidatus Thermoplasmatota archaeon]|nr:PH domain-containing protein [Candidatus Thermoplasmatota archaeon]